MLRRLFIALLCCAPLVSCSEPPAKERHQADEAIAAAHAAEAVTYAPAELATAEQAIAQYDEAVAQRDYRQALNFAMEARDRAYVASRVAGEQKAAARSQAERLFADYGQLVTAAKTRLSATGAARLRPPVVDRVRTAVRRAPDLLQESRARIDKADFRGAVKLLEPAVQALRQDLAAPAARSGRGRG